MIEDALVMQPDPALVLDTEEHSSGQEHHNRRDNQDCLFHYCYPMEHRQMLKLPTGAVMKI